MIRTSHAFGGTALGLLEPVSKVRIATDGATVVVTPHELRVIGRAGGDAPTDTYRVVDESSAENSTASLVLVRGEQAPVVLLQYRGRRRVKAAQQALAALAMARCSEARRGFPWLKTATVIGVVWVAVRLLAGVATAPPLAQASVIPTHSLATPQLPDTQSPTANPNLMLPQLPSGPVTCGNFE